MPWSCSSRSEFTELFRNALEATCKMCCSLYPVGCVSSRPCWLQHSANILPSPFPGHRLPLAQCPGAVQVWGVRPKVKGRKRTSGGKWENKRLEESICFPVWFSSSNPSITQCTVSALPFVWTALLAFCDTGHSCAALSAPGTLQILLNAKPTGL